MISSKRYKLHKYHTKTNHATVGFIFVIEIKYSQQAARLNSGHKKPASCKWYFDTLAISGAAVFYWRVRFLKFLENFPYRFPRGRRGMFLIKFTIKVFSLNVLLNLSIQFNFLATSDKILAIDHCVTENCVDIGRHIYISECNMSEENKKEAFA